MNDKAGTWDRVTVEESASIDESIAQQEKQAWRMFAPFAMIVCLVLLGLFYWLSGGSLLAARLDSAAQAGTHHRPGAAGGHGVACKVDEAVFAVRQGDTCWAIAERHGMSMSELREMNEGLVCEALPVGGKMCVKARN